MSKTEKVFQDAIKLSAELIKMINEDGYDIEDKEVEKKNDEIAQMQIKLLDLPYDFEEIDNLENYCKKVLGNKYFFDNRCWNYLTDVVYDIEKDIAWNL